jgi:hypothetical protein
MKLVERLQLIEYGESERGERSILAGGERVKIMILLPLLCFLYSVKGFGFDFNLSMSFS